MCGIVGILSKSKQGFFQSHAELFTYMLEFDSIRGEDSTGMFGVDSRGNVEILKGNANGYLFTHSQDYQKMQKKISSKYNIVVGHNRKATAGAITPENAHPFQEGGIVIVHNGVVRNVDKLDIENAKEVEVDSHALAHLLAKHDAKGALEQINGAFALVWYDKNTKTLSLARNEERPLGLIEYGDIWVISSEFGLPLWLQRREQRKELRCITVPTDKILIWHLDELSSAPKELDWDEYAAYRRVEPIPVTPKSYEPSSYNSWPREKIKPMFNHGQKNLLVFQDKVGDVQLKEGSVVTFTFDEDKETQHGGWEVVGSLVVDGIKDENIVVRWPMSKLEFDRRENELTTYNFFTGAIRAVGKMHGVPVIYMDTHSVKPIKLIRSFDGGVHNTDEIIDALKTGCGRCSLPILEKDVERTLLKKREDGSGKYRILCHECLHESIKQAEISKHITEKQQQQQTDLRPAANS